jgi:hypothetical protein
LGLAKSLTGLRLKKFKKPWAWACPNKFSTPEICDLFSELPSMVAIDKFDCTGKKKKGSIFNKIG